MNTAPLIESGSAGANAPDRKTAEEAVAIATQKIRSLVTLPTHTIASVYGSVVDTGVGCTTIEGTIEATLDAVDTRAFLHEVSEPLIVAFDNGEIEAYFIRHYRANGGWCQISVRCVCDFVIGDNPVLVPVTVTVTKKPTKRASRTA